MATEENELFSRMRRGVGLQFDTSGYWTYPALVSLAGADLGWLSLVMKTAPLHEKKRTALFRPFAMVLTQANTGMVLRYENFRLGHDPFSSLAWDKPVAMFPHQSVAELNYADFQEDEQHLMSAYEPASKKFSVDGELPKEFVDLYLRLTHPVALPYLKCLATDFFKALGVEQPAGGAS